MPRDINDVEKEGESGPSRVDEVKPIVVTEGSLPIDTGEESDHHVIDNPVVAPIDELDQSVMADRSPHDDTDMPPNSRVYVLCPREAPEELIKKAFDPYGEVQWVKVIRERGEGSTLGASKGMAFVKYNLASSAALAIESLNNQCLIAEGVPKRAMKLMLAQPRGAKGVPRSKFVSNHPDDLPPNSRLFLVVEKDATTDQLYEKFSPYGGVQGVRIVKDRNTQESKGIAYIKFTLASQAAKAMEGIVEEPEGMVKKCTLAKSHQPKKEYSMDYPTSRYPEAQPQGYDAYGSGGRSQYYQQSILQPPIQHQQQQPQSQGGGDYCRLFVKCPITFSKDDLFAVFQPFGTVAICDLKVDRGTGVSKGFGFITYTDADSAGRALRLMHGNNYGIQVKYAEPYQPGGVSRESRHVSTNRSQDQSAMYYQHQPSASSYAQPAYYQDPISDGGRNRTANTRVKFLIEGLMHQDALRDVFGRFQGFIALVEVQSSNDKTWGIVEYDSANAATGMVECLNGNEVQAHRFYVTVEGMEDMQHTKRARMMQ